MYSEDKFIRKSLYLSDPSPMGVPMGPPLWKLHVHFHWFSGMQCSETLCFFWRLTLYAQDSGAAAQDSGGAAQDSGGVAPDCRRKRNRQLVDFGNFGQLWQRSNLQHLVLDLLFCKSTRNCLSALVIGFTILSWMAAIKRTSTRDPDMNCWLSANLTQILSRFKL